MGDTEGFVVKLCVCVCVFQELLEMVGGWGTLTPGRAVMSLLREECDLWVERTYWPIWLWKYCLEVIPEDTGSSAAGPGGCHSVPTGPEGWLCGYEWLLLS